MIRCYIYLATTDDRLACIEDLGSIQRYVRVAQVNDDLMIRVALTRSRQALIPVADILRVESVGR